MVEKVSREYKELYRRWVLSKTLTLIIKMLSISVPILTNWVAGQSDFLDNIYQIIFAKEDHFNAQTALSVQTQFVLIWLDWFYVEFDKYFLRKVEITIFIIMHALISSVFPVNSSLVIWKGRITLMGSSWGRYDRNMIEKLPMNLNLCISFIWMNVPHQLCWIICSSLMWSCQHREIFPTPFIDNVPQNYKNCGCDGIILFMFFSCCDY